MGGPISEQDLKKAISSTLRRQHLMSTIPSAQRVLPFAVLALGDYIARKQKDGTNVVENFLCAGTDVVDDTGILIASKDATVINNDGSGTKVITCCPFANQLTINEMLAQHGSNRLTHQGVANWLELKRQSGG